MPKLTAQDWRDILQLDARERRSGLPQGLLTAVLMQESGGDSDIVNEKSGATGLFQFIPGTAKDFGINPRDPFQAADGAERYLTQLHGRYKGDTKRALAAYNWGPGNVDENGLANLPRETQGYLGKILGWLGPRSAEAAPAQARGGSFIDSPAFESWLARGRGSQPEGAAPEMPPCAPATPDAEAAPAPEMPPRTPGVQRITVDIPYAQATPAAPTTPQGQVSNEEALKLQDAQIAQRYGYDPALVMQSGNYKPGMLADMHRRGIYAGAPAGIGATAYEEPSTLGNLALRAGHGLGSVVTGANQLLQTGLEKIGLGSQGSLALADLRAKQLEAARQGVAAHSPTGAGFAAELVGGMAAPLPLPAVGGRLATAAVRGSAGAALTQPALHTSPNPEERNASFAAEKGTQALVGGVAGAALDTVGRGLAGLGRIAIGQSRGQKALDVATTANAQAERTYASQVDDVLEKNLADLEGHLQRLGTYEKKVQRFGREETARGQRWDRTADKRLAETARANTQAQAEHVAAVAEAQQTHLIAQKDYQTKIDNQAMAVEGARKVPGKYGPETLPAVQKALATEVPTAEPLVGRSVSPSPRGIGEHPYKTASGGWRVPLKEVPPQELELQDFIRQPRGNSGGGVKLGDEELFTEVHELLGRKEGGAQAASLLNEKQGRSLQALAEEAQQHGFLQEADTGELLDVIRTSMGGQKVYSRYRTPPDIGNAPGTMTPTTLAPRAPASGNVVDALYEKVRAVGGAAPVQTGAAKEAAGTVAELLGMHATPSQGSPLSRLAGAINELGDEATVQDILPLIQDAGKLMRAGDGQARGMARNLFAGLHAALEQSADQLPETAQARELLMAATQAARRNFAVGDLEDIVRMSTGRNSTGEFKTLNIAQVLRTIERRFAGDSPRDKLFSRSFTPEERTQILGDFERFAGLHPIPAKAPTLGTLPDAPVPKVAQFPALPQGRELPIALEQPPVAPTLATLPEVPGLQSPTLEPIQLSKLVRNTAYGSGLGALGSVAGLGYGTGAAVGAAVGISAEVGAQLFAKAFLNPRLRPIILRAVGPDGSIDPRVYGYLANQFTQERDPQPPRE